MTRTITLRIDHPELGPGPVDGFRYLWAFRVSGFRSDRHCQPCFRGSLAKDFATGTVQSGRGIHVTLAPQHRYLYVCGVGSGPKSELHRKNLHLPLRYEEGSIVRKTTYNGYVVTAQNAVELPIPGLEPGWNGRDLETTRCKNFQFGMAYLGDEEMQPAESRGHE